MNWVIFIIVGIINLICASFWNTTSLLIGISFAAKKTTNQYKFRNLLIISIVLFIVPYLIILASLFWINSYDLKYLGIILLPIITPIISLTGSGFHYLFFKNKRSKKVLMLILGILCNLFAYITSIIPLFKKKVVKNKQSKFEYNPEIQELPKSYDTDFINEIEHLQLIGIVNSVKKKFPEEYKNKTLTINHILFSVMDDCRADTYLDDSSKFEHKWFKEPDQYNYYLTITVSDAHESFYQSKTWTFWFNENDPIQSLYSGRRVNFVNTEGQLRLDDLREDVQRKIEESKTIETVTNTDIYNWVRHYISHVELPLTRLGEMKNSLAQTAINHHFKEVFGKNLCTQWFKHPTKKNMLVIQVSYDKTKEKFFELPDNIADIVIHEHQQQ